MIRPGLRGPIYACIVGGALTACNAGATIGPAPGASPARPTVAPTATAISTPVTVPVNPRPTGSVPPNATPVPTPTPTATPAATATAAPTATPVPTPTPTAPPPTPAGTKIYVGNHSAFGAGNASAPSVTVYPVAANGNATPIARLAGPTTRLTQTQYVAVDSTGRAYVSNEGTYGNPDITYSTITEYDNLQGDVAPVVTIGGIRRPEGLAIDARDNLYVITDAAVYVLPRGATTLSQATNVVTGPNTQILLDYGLFVESSGKIDLAGANAIVTFAPGAMGDAVPAQFIYGQATMLASDLGIAADSAGTLYATNLNTNTVLSFNPTDTTKPSTNSSVPTTGPPPKMVYASALFNKPWGIFIDPGDAIYIANDGNNSILAFSSAALLATGVTTQTISGAATGLDNPIGVYVR